MAGTDQITADQTTKRKKWLAILVILLTLLVLLQLARFVVGPLKITNPPATYTVQWDSARTQTIWQESCHDCHSNATTWPWYAYIAPPGWLVAWDVHRGREEFNISEGWIPADEIAEVIREGEMPPWQYRLIHTGAKLDETEKNDLLAGLQATFGFTVETEPEGESEGEDD